MSTTYLESIYHHQSEKLTTFFTIYNLITLRQNVKSVARVNNI